jgi:hypothetical protein
MKFICLDGSEIKMAVRPSEYPRRLDASKCQTRIGDLIEELFPHQILLEEFVIPKSGGLKIDFFLPTSLIAVEADGGQHNEFVPYFHQDKIGFQRSKNNDKRKEEWCRINNIRIIRVDDSTTKEALSCLI